MDPVDDDSLPAHRVVTRAIVTSIVAAPVMAAAICAGCFSVDHFDLTLVFNLATVLLFLAHFDHIVPFYTNPLPWGL